MLLHLAILNTQIQVEFVNYEAPTHVLSQSDRDIDTLGTRQNVYGWRFPLIL